MISEIQWPALKKSKVFGYAADVAFFQANKGVTFKPGLNILFGPNGSGKSTIQRMAALTLAAEQGGVSTVTGSWLDSLFEFDKTSKLEGIGVVHDGQPVLYGNPRNVVGLFGGGAAFDSDFSSEGLSNLMSKASTGYTTLGRMQRMLAVLQGGAPFPAEFDNRLNRGGGPSSDQRLAAAMQLLKGSIPKGQQTLLFDEPESGLGLPVQGNLFKLIDNGAREKGLQVIIATHSAFALCLPGANYIEMSPGYLSQSENAVQSVHVRLEMARLLAELEKLKTEKDLAPAVKKKKTAGTTSKK